MNTFFIINQIGTTSNILNHTYNISQPEPSQAFYELAHLEPSQTFDSHKPSHPKTLHTPNPNIDSIQQIIPSKYI